MERITMVCNGAWLKLGSMFGSKPVAKEEITCPLCKGKFPIEVKGASKIQFEKVPDMNPFGR